MQARFIRPEDTLWGECLSDMFHDFYHLPDYVRVSADLERGQPLAFMAQDGPNRALVPLILRPIDSPLAAERGLLDATSPYGYGSPLSKSAENGGMPARFLDAVLELLLAGLRQRGVVSLFLRLHPLLPLPLDPFRRLGTLVRHGETVFVDLTLPEAEIWNQTRRQFRNRINHAKRIGCVAQIDHHWDDFDTFFDIYTKTMQRVDAAESYFFPRDYFYKLRDALAGALHLCIVRVDGAAACAGMFTETCGIVQAHLSGSRPEYAREHPVKFMMDFARHWAKERQNRLFHLGGGVGAKKDFLFQFKSGFSKLRGDFHTWRAVIDHDQYQALVHHWQQDAAAQAEDPSGFFPAYRNSPPLTSQPAAPLQ